MTDLNDEKISNRGKKLEKFDYWRLCDELTVVEAALLLQDRDPSGDYCYVEGWELHQRPEGYEGSKNAISRALANNVIQGKRVLVEQVSDEGQGVAGEIDVSKSVVDVESLRNWLSSRGISTGFFFPKQKTAEYLDPSHPRYAPKLAAAVHAWLETAEIKGGTPKQALQKWLRNHAGQYDLCDEDGKHNEQGIDEVAKVANWQRSGGAPKTP